MNAEAPQPPFIPYAHAIECMDRAARSGTDFVFAIDFDRHSALFVPHPLRQNEVLFDFSGITNAPRPDTTVQPVGPLIAQPVSYETYAKAFATVRQGLMQGNSFLCNLTMVTPIGLHGTLHDVYHTAKARYKLYVPDRFVCFSPERFVQVDEAQQISTFPMKGTIDATLPHAREIIRNDYKETAEHYTIVDLMRNDLNQVAHGVHVARFRYIDEIVTQQGALLQVSSEIRGSLRETYRHRPGSLLHRLLPAGSISGAPKPATLALIREAEPLPRGFYSGVCGYYHDGQLDSGVMIRYIAMHGSDSYCFHSGGGITVNSDCHSEYEEMLQKIYLPTAER